MREEEQGNDHDGQSDPGGPTFSYILIMHEEPLDIR
jgi:hypothetical protein